jgi:RNA polymerase sigma factor (sigma-70 family)
MMTEVPASRDVPAEGVDLAELETAVKRMPRRRRQIFLAIVLDEMPYGEIAERIGVSIKRVEQEFAAAMYELDKALSERVRPSWRHRLFRWLAGVLRR